MSGSDTRKEELLTCFRSLFGGEPEAWVRAPGRAELLGTDTDDHLGYVMTMSIHLDTWIAFRPSGSATARVHSMNLGESTEFRIGEEPAEPAASWDRYVSGVSRILQLEGYRPQGVEAVIHSTVPIGGQHYIPIDFARVVWGSDNCMLQSEHVARMSTYMRQMGAGSKQRELIFGDTARKLLKLT